MKLVSAVSALVALAIGQAAASTLNHRHFHPRRDPHVQPAEIAKRGVLSQAGSSRLASVGCLSAKNSAVNNGQAWLGNDGPYTNTFINNATDEVTLVIWGPAGSWVNVIAPLVAVSLPPGSEQVVSFAEGASGAYAGIYPNTKAVNGQISNTWGEYTFNGIYSTVDVSREVNMQGNPMTIKTPTCTSSFTQCVFQCVKSVTSCTFDYELVNCAPGSQPGAGSGFYYGAPSGGCMGITRGSSLTTTFH